MPRKVRVLTTSFGNAATRTIDDNRELAASFVGAAGAEQADLVCVPESFLLTNLPSTVPPHAEPLDGPTYAALGEQAKKHGTWVVACTLIRHDNGTITNTALVIDRDGELAAQYAKIHPTMQECDNVTPGSDVTVVDTDFGRIGLAICFDIGWPSHWQALADAGAELVVWPSEYDGGFPLQAYAWLHQYYLVSCVRTKHSKVIDITGNVLATTSEWHRLAAITIDLEKKLFHIDGQVDKIRRIQQERGAAVDVRAYSQENVFTLQSNEPEWPVSRLEEAYGLEDFTRYHLRSTGVQDRHREAARKPDATRSR